MVSLGGEGPPGGHFMRGSGPLGVGHGISIICVLAAEEATSHLGS